jgi:hypothetical protein
VVDALTEEEVDLKICHCCRWANGSNPFGVCELRFGVGKICDCGWVCDLGLEKFVIVAGFAIWGWKIFQSLSLLWVGLRSGVTVRW